MISSYLAVVDVTNGTNVNMGLGTLESSSQTTDGQLVAGEDVVNGVDGARAQQRRPAGARQEVDGTGNARHLYDTGSQERPTKEQKAMESRNAKVGRTSGENRINTQFFRTSSA